MENIKDKTVAEIVTHNYKTADVFKKYGIDFCCGGQMSVTNVCDKKDIDLADLERDLNQIDIQRETTNNYDGWELDFLIDYIISVHHSYVIENIPRISEYADKVAKVHGHHFKEVIEIKALFSALSEELLFHLQKEENILFPFIREILEATKIGRRAAEMHCGSILNPIQMMEMEHEHAGDTFKRIAELSNNYTPPAEACNTYNVLYAKLKEFEEDLHMHIHLENNILFPKAIRLSELADQSSSTVN